MQTYIIRRLILMLPTLFGLSFLVFIMVRLMPGDIVALISGDYGSASEETRAAILKDFQLDANIPTQYARWLGQMVRLDLGSSLISSRPVGDELANRLPVTLELGILALIFNVSIGVPVGIISAVRQNSWADYVGRSVAIGFLAAPNFWIALILFALAGRYFHWAVPPTTYVPFTEDPIGNLKLMVVPALILGGAGSGGVMRFTRTAMLETLRQDYVRTARSKGLTERVVVLRHALRNALIPVVTILGLTIPNLVGGSVIIETVYSIPGMGRYYISAINQLDFPIIQVIALVSALVVVFANLAVDLAYSYLDPRIRYS
ncbi:MAG: ABC transporter permease [Dehalococcoidia bacterium]|nr:ABC transporter permease [Dehalococcoidia bacterium]MCA9849573.1 ABC transporter permease [Dehalococcoidia bacterium]MCA9856255.1 ABC transporter permease [Dehalococcoidia bacterium]MCB9484151.1 ABC transporter permease [Dehalococcoidia bacterium]MCB9491169.1 ABC transporter permease [Dehalococcoidia bacterium]